MKSRARDLDSQTDKISHSSDFSGESHTVCKHWPPWHNRYQTHPQLRINPWFCYVTLFIFCQCHVLRPWLLSSVHEPSILILFDANNWTQKSVPHKQTIFGSEWQARDAGKARQKLETRRLICNAVDKFLILCLINFRREHFSLKPTERRRSFHHCVDCLHPPAYNCCWIICQITVRI